jgi:hypothetical protein
VGAVDRSGESQVGQEAAVIGVVIAGVLVSFTIPGPFDWGSMLIGTIMLSVLLAYGTWPQGVDQLASWRRALGMATAGAFCAVQLLGRPLDAITWDGRRLLSHWEDGNSRDEDIPAASAGWELGLLWFFALLGCMVLWWLIERKRDRNPPEPDPAVRQLPADSQPAE